MTKNIDQMVMKETLNFITLDFPENSHIIGATEKGDTVLDHYKGFLYMFRLYNGENSAQDSFGDEVKEYCGQL
jgi:hypothetical protein